MCIKIREEHRELIQKMSLTAEHAKLDCEAAKNNLADVFIKALEVDNIKLLDEPWDKFQEFKDELQNQHNGLWTYLKEHYPETKEGKWVVDVRGWELHRVPKNNLIAELVASLNRGAAQSFQGSAPPGAQPAAA